MPKKKSSKNENPRSSRRRRKPAPVPVILKLHQQLDENENHPLRNMDAERRGVDRQHLIATILARIADSESRNQSDADTI
ncbi:hypothetical protein KOR42_33990 [Thalassoglobus neptunius]|uniref:Uncharacterized protein n=1 Tax=Thalassoglobus neptunius TaxID=1938619 RepID=A0A5C5WPE2_9PLAN|nr:hypothetical protein KOR42_33990 [Thalassoglobus neptunius]